MDAATLSAQLEMLRPQLLRFARSQLRNEAWAEDAVSDTLLAAAGKAAAYTGQSQLKTWLIGILKHKLIDQLRRHAREATVLDGDDAEDLDDLLFRANGHWNNAPRDWGTRRPPAASGSSSRCWKCASSTCRPPRAGSS